jgi:hypothetical protein
VARFPSLVTGSAERTGEALESPNTPRSLQKCEDISEYLIESLGTSAFDLCCSSKAQQREIAMSNLVFGVPVRTRLPLKVWAVAAAITLFSLASSMIHSPASSDHAVYAGVTGEHQVARGS